MKGFYAYLTSFGCYHRLYRFILIGATLGVGVIIFGNLSIRQAAANRVYDSLEITPRSSAALVLGCSKTLPNGRGNLFFRYRINAAAALYRAGKVEYLIVSGDNHREGYDEPTDMRDALIAGGVPENRIYRDYAGFRTLDSVVRAREIFNQTSLIIVSQRFHAERAIFIAREHGVDAIGFQARDVETFGGLRTRLREHLARFKTVLDVWVLGTEPKFLGPKIALGGPVN